MSNFRKLVSNKIFNVSFKLITFGCLAFGIISTFVNGSISALVMYTNLSVLIVTLEYLMLIVLIIIKYDYHKRWVQVVRLCANSMLLLTFIVFGVILTPAALITNTPNVFGISSIFKHFVSPILMIFDYFVIDKEKYQLKKTDFFIAISLTILYTILIYIRGAIRTDLPHLKAGGSKSRYPYFFFDPYFVGCWFEGGTENIHIGIFPWIIILVTLFCLIIFFEMKLKKKTSIKEDK